MIYKYLNKIGKKLIYWVLGLNNLTEKLIPFVSFLLQRDALNLEPNNVANCVSKGKSEVRYLIYFVIPLNTQLINVVRNIIAKWRRFNCRNVEQSSGKQHMIEAEMSAHIVMELLSCIILSHKSSYNNGHSNSRIII